MAELLHPVDHYAQAVITGAVPAGKYHRLACARHLRDRARENTPGFPYRFDGAKADRFLRFGSKLRHYKGEWAGQFITFTPCQVFRLGSIFGWVRADTGLRRFRTSYNELPRKQGKALALDTSVPTPDGWKAHGDLRVGDRVFAPDGRPVAVKWAGPVHEGPCYRLTVNTGESFVAHARHEWVTQRTWYTGRAKGSRGPMPPVETQRIATTLRCGARGDYVHRIAVAGALELPDRELPLAPYVLGVWLADGDSGSGGLTIAETDLEIVERIRNAGIDCREVRQVRGARRFRLDGWQGSVRRSMTGRLRRMGVLNNKRIPAAYLRASKAQRLELLRGIIDADGHRDTRGYYELVTVLEPLAGDYLELLNTLGLKANLIVDRAQLNGRDYGPRYRVTFSPHEDEVAHLARKRGIPERTRRRRSRGRTIVACEPCEPVPVSCIEVEGGVYLVGRQFIATHNSLEAAVVADYATFFDGEPGADGFTAATKRDQALIVFKDAKRLVESSGLKTRIKVNAANLHRVDLAQKLEPLSADHNSMDGLNPHFVSLDEFHAHKDRGVIDVLETAMGARRQPLMFQITTAGDDPVSPCGDQHDYCCKILEQVLIDETFFGFIAHADPEDDWLSEATWAKANPHYGVSVKPDDMRALATKAIGIPAAAAAFKQKRLNLWVNATAPCLSLDGWRKGQTEWTAQDMLHQRCFVGVDLASKLDLMALVFLFPPTDTRVSWRMLTFAWTPEETIKDRSHRDRAPYEVWVQQGWLKTTPGAVLDHGVIQATLQEHRSLFNIELIGFDPWHADKVVSDLTSGPDGFDQLQVLSVPQTYQSLSGAEADFQAEVLAGHIDAGGSPLVAWCASNVVSQTDGKDNIFFTKKRSRGRIDPIKAATTAMKLAKGTTAKPEPSFQMFFAGGKN